MMFRSVIYTVQEGSLLFRRCIRIALGPYAVKRDNMMFRRVTYCSVRRVLCRDNNDV